MTTTAAPDPPATPRGTNRALLLVLISSVICVLALGTWRLLGQDPPPSPTEPRLDPAAALGAFYMPAEFERQDILYLGGDQLARQHPDVMIAIARAAAAEVRLTILAGSGPGRATIDSLLSAHGLADGQVAVQTVPVKTMWVRDFGPLTVTDVHGQRSMVEFKGGVRRGDRRDGNVAAVLAVNLELAILGNQLQLDGGDVLTNGRGLGLLSRRTVAGNAGNRDSGQPDILPAVAAMLGFENIVLLPPLAGEFTGHVDQYCTFVAEDLVLVGRLAAQADAVNAALLDRIAQDLVAQPTLAGPLRVERIAQPDHADGVWRSYTSAVPANGVVLVPVYPDYCPDLDAQALALYRRLWPDRVVVGIDAESLAQRNTTLRCVTMNVPAGAALAESAGH